MWSYPLVMYWTWKKCLQPLCTLETEWVANDLKLVCLIPGAEFKALTFSDSVICVSDPAAQVSLAKEILILVKFPDLIKVI